MSNSFVTPWTIACQAPLSMGFPKQEYWRGLPFLSLGDLPSSTIVLMSPAWQVVSLSLSHLEDCIKGIKYTERRLYMNAKNLWKISGHIFICVHFVTLHLIWKAFLIFTSHPSKNCRNPWVHSWLHLLLTEWVKLLHPELIKALLMLLVYELHRTTFH